jgi:hypothetical protein
MSGSRIQTAILADDSVAVFNESTQRMLSLNRTAAYLWFRHAEVDHAELARDLAARVGMDLADAKRTIDDHIATWKAAGFIASDQANDVATLTDLATTRSRSTPDPLRPTEPICRAPAAGASLFGRLAGLNFCIRYEPDGLRPSLEPALQHLVAVSGSPDVAIEVRRDNAGWTVLEGERVLAGGLGANEVVPVVIYGLLDGVLRRSPNSIAFHASAARRDGRCVLLAAPPGSGKSTLCAALLSRGYEFIADDVVLFDDACLGVRGVPLPLSLKEGSWSPLMNVYPQLEATAIHVRPDRKLVRFLVPPALASANESHAVTSIIFPQFAPNSALEHRPIDQSLAFNRLVSEATTSKRRLSGDKFNDLARFVRPTKCWELGFSDLDRAVDAIDQIYR